MPIAAIIAMPVPMMYISVGGKEVTGYGAGVAAAVSTANDVVACDGQ